jgi:2-aminoadipate transaminase
VSPPVHIAARLREVRGSAIRDLLALTARADVVSLAGGRPATDLLPHARIAAATAAALADPAVVQYGETAGLRRLRDVVAAHESRRRGRRLTGDDVVVTSGSQQALDLVARAALDPGDAVVVEDPVYVGALQAFQAAGAALHAVAVDADGMDVGALAALLSGGLRPRLVHTVSSFHNPRGVTLAPCASAG